MVDISVDIGGLKLKNPLILASASYTGTAAGLKKQITKGYSAVVTKTVTVKPLKGAPKPTVFWYDPEEKTMLSGAEGLKNPGIAKMVEAIQQVRDLAIKEDCKLIGSCSGNTIEEILYICEEFEKAGVDAIELNMICPSTGPHLGEEYAKLGKWWAEDIQRSIKLITKVKEIVNIPVLAKIQLDQLLKKAYMEELDRIATHDAYSFIGGRTPILKIDIESGKPVFPGNILLRIDKNLPISPMVTGPVKPSTVLHTAYFSKLTKIPLICSGGLTKGSDVIEAIMAGASAVQICVVVYKDLNSGPRILKEIVEVMDKNGYKDLDEIRGITLNHLPNPPLFTVPGAVLD